MKYKLVLWAVVWVLIIPDAYAQARRPSAPSRQHQTSVVLGARRHSEHSIYDELPFTNRDMSYVLGWEVHDVAGFWQLGVNYTPDIGDATNGVRYAVSPFANLLLKDRGWLAGVGVMSSYVAYEEEREWTSIYWQLMLGFSIPVSRFEVDVMVYYPFKRWNEIREFSTRDLEFGGLLRYHL